MGKPYFIFESWRDVEAYRYLKHERRGKVDKEVEANAKAEIAFEEADADEPLRKALEGRLAIAMADGLQELILGEVSTNNELCEMLLEDAIQGINFEKVARAFLEDVDVSLPVKHATTDESEDDDE